MGSGVRKGIEIRDEGVVDPGDRGTQGPGSTGSQGREPRDVSARTLALRLLISLPAPTFQQYCEISYPRAPVCLAHLNQENQEREEIFFVLDQKPRRG